MSIDITNIIGQPESQTLAYKAVLPPSKIIARIICSFANSDGGYIILGVTDDMDIVGLSSDFRPTAIVYKAINLISPKPQVEHQSTVHNGKNLYIIKIEKSEEIVLLEGKQYKREGDVDKLENPIEVEFKSQGYSEIGRINNELESYKNGATSAKIKLIEHYQSILKIIDDLDKILYPSDPNIPTTNQEGKILTRILFSSFADNFETYLSDLLYEIFLANPDTLKSQKEVTIKEVLDCSDMQEFVHYWANKQISKLQKGSVKGFIEDNKQISKLEAIDGLEQKEIEKILQVRHLYSHRNGIVDEKFLQYFSGEFDLNSEYEIPISELLKKLLYISGIVNNIDAKAINKYRLAEISTS